ncbi:Histone deacetylase complex subunit SAP18 [Golovinomyces cichoracearum]|uniref:Histone deacetylase complex subunit SAP18 n=1 Tax=Golovinomyces cichoracearum TaxID=62708 RepID=A0A420HDG5_9PEZI|nr:Histone deacetylase complex subunit SAP18 [Golovinomyces cichoracearum]
MASILGKVDRQTTTPFFLKLFYRTGSFHRIEEFQPLADLPPHLQIYTWSSCTLRELTHILSGSIPSLLPDPAIGCRIAFRLIYPEQVPRNAPASVISGPGKYVMRDLGSIVIGSNGPGILPDEEEAAIIGGGQLAGSLGGEPDKTLQDAKFMIGDYIACAILPPDKNGVIAPPPASISRSNYAMGRSGELGSRGGNSSYRENGFGGGYRGRGAPRVPSGEWRRGERLPDGPSGGRGRGYGGGYGGYGSRGGRY